VPHILGLSEHRTHKLNALPVGVRLAGRIAGQSCSRSALLLLLSLVELHEERSRIAPQAKYDQDDDEHADAAPHHHRTARAAAILDVVA
jgi:hypothetical protein